MFKCILQTCMAMVLIQQCTLLCILSLISCVSSPDLFFISKSKRLCLFRNVLLKMGSTLACLLGETDRK